MDVHLLIWSLTLLILFISYQCYRFGIENCLFSILPRKQLPRFSCLKKPDYKQENVSIPGASEEVRLAGELFYPKDKAPIAAMLMLSGSGPYDRDEQMYGHKPFWVFADYMVKQGYAVLRFDDRGVGESSGDFASATSEDFAKDALNALQWLSRYEPLKQCPCGIVGHSEGGMISPFVAQMAQEQELYYPQFLILLGAPAQSVKQILIEQQVMIAKAEQKTQQELDLILNYSKALYELAQSEQDSDLLRFKLEIYMKKQGYLSKRQREQAIEILSSRWMRWLLNYNPEQAITNYQQPVLALFGEKDTQVDALDNSRRFKELFRHKASQVKILSRLNHLFQPCKTGVPSEYPWIGISFDYSALDACTKWLGQINQNLPSPKRSNNSHKLL